MAKTPSRSHVSKSGSAAISRRSNRHEIRALIMLAIVLAITLLLVIVNGSMARQYAVSNPNSMAASVILAADIPASGAGGSGTFRNPLETGSLTEFLENLLDVVILIGSIAVVASIIFAGLRYVMAHGDEGEIESAHKQLTWTVIGAAVLLGAKVIAMVIKNTVQQLS